jgi:beta-barrel assembly-enhancing protease
MENNTVLFYDGVSARPTPVRVLLFNDSVHLHDESDDRLLQSFPLAGTAHNVVGATHYLYLDARGLMYLQYDAGHLLAGSLANEVEKANPGWAQRLMKQKTIVLIPVMLALIVGLYFLLVNLVPFLGMRMIGVQQEIIMGDKLREVMQHEEQLIGAQVDTARTQQLQDFADALELSRDYPIRISLVRSDVVNAYALPGGQVVVYSGILEKIQTPEALAALLAHESVHVNERHSLRSMLRSAANGIIVSVIFSDASGLSGALVSNAEALNGLRYSRSLEAEADRQAMDLLLANGVNLEGMRQLMKTLQDEGDVPGSLSFLSSHPLTKERIRAADRYISQHPQKETDRTELKEIFEELKED